MNIHRIINNRAINNLKRTMVNFRGNNTQLQNDTFEITTKKSDKAENVSKVIMSSSTKSDATKQSQYYLKHGIIPAGTKILNGFVDPGGHGIINDDGSTESPREIIVIDRAQDEKLQKMISDFKGMTEILSERKCAGFLKTIVQYLSEKSSNEVLENSSNLPDNEKMLIGKIIDKDAAVCRHKALLYKIIGEDAGLKIDVVKGNLDDYRHAWNIVHLNDGSKILVDTSNNVMQDISGDCENIEIEVKGEKLKYTQMNN